LFQSGAPIQNAPAAMCTISGTRFCDDAMSFP
jgi:hypothetical protein